MNRSLPMHARNTDYRGERLLVRLYGGDLESKLSRWLMCGVYGSNLVADR